MGVHDLAQHSFVLFFLANDPELVKRGRSKARDASIQYPFFRIQLFLIVTCVCARAQLGIVAVSEGAEEAAV